MDTKTDYRDQTRNHLRRDSAKIVQIKLSRAERDDQCEDDDDIRRALNSGSASDFLRDLSY